MILATDTGRLDEVRVISVDEHRWSHTRRASEDGYVTVIIDLIPVKKVLTPAGRCHPRHIRHRECQQNKPLWCDRAHCDNDAKLGQPLCGDCYDYVDHVFFAWHAPELRRRFTIRLRPRLRREMRYRAEQPDQTRISFMKVVELQRRGLPHFHAVIRLDAAPEAGRPPSVPDTTVSAHDFAVLVRQAATERTLSVRGDKLLRFGEQIDIKVIASAAEKQGNDSEIFQPPDRRLPRKIRHQISRKLWHRSSQDSAQAQSTNSTLSRLRAMLSSPA
jgi:hypothetical protein